MHIAWQGWLLIGLYVVFAMTVGVVVSRRAGKNVDEYFVAGRTLPWWVAGTSIVATTFAIDTPLLISGWARSDGIWRNWSWWCYAVTTLLGVFLFAKLWRRGEVVTKAELSELRYGERSARYLRGTLGVIHAGLTNTITMAWVLLAFIKIAEVLLGFDKHVAVVIACAIAMGYSLLGGFLGVVLTDLVQFALATIGAIWFAVLVWNGVGPIWDPAVAANITPEQLAFFPESGGGSWLSAAFWTTPLAILAVNLGVGWYASEGIDGSGLVVQRVAAAKSERDGTLAMLWYGITNYAVRPWPWILVGLLSLSVFQSLEVTAPVSGTVVAVESDHVILRNDTGETRVELEHESESELWKLEPASVQVDAEVAVGDVLARTDNEKAYPAMMAKFLGPWLLGLVIASLLAAFMSTIDTHVNLASAFFTNDLYRRFMQPDKSDRHYVLVARLASVGALAIASVFALQIGTIANAFLFFIALLGGVGPTYAMRWLWWRVRAGAEIAAMLTSGISAMLLTFVFDGESFGFTWPDTALSPGGVLEAEGRLLIVVVLSTAAALITMRLSGPPDPKDLVPFYRRFRPPGFWGPVRAHATDLPEVKPILVPAIVGTLSGLGLIWGLMLGVGYALVGDASATWICGIAAVLGGAGVAFVLRRAD
tara:strand:+ start:5486 stop:7438 length:1953 start_codon:yes stop_codon:yes gene_type:complete